MGGGNGMQIDSVLRCALQIDSYETGGRVGVDGTQWAHRARVLDPTLPYPRSLPTASTTSLDNLQLLAVTCLSYCTQGPTLDPTLGYHRCRSPPTLDPILA